MKLEIKHIAPYLPYGLKVDTLKLGNGYNIMVMCDKSGLSNISIADVIDEYPYAKPIHRPLSDLTTYLRNEFEKLDRGYVYDKIAVDLFCEENGVDEIIENIELKSLPYECVEYMFRNHYDVFGLIEQGLAISIHDVQLKEIKA